MQKPGTAGGGRSAAVGDALSAARAVDGALERAVGRLLSRQHTEGWWCGELQACVAVDARDLLLRWFADLLDRGRATRSVRWIRSQQQPDGSWSSFQDGPGDLTTSILAYTALRVAGDARTASHMQHAAAFIRSQGGLARLKPVPGGYALALLGLWPWAQLPSLPPEMVLLPAWFPLSVYRFLPGGRVSVVTTSVLTTLRHVRPCGFGLDELQAEGRPAGLQGMGRLGNWLLSAPQAYERLAAQPLRRLALTLAGEWVVRHQDADGTFCGNWASTMDALLALRFLGFPARHPAVAAAVRGLDVFEVWDGAFRRVQMFTAPVRDTAMAMLALGEAGRPAHDPALVRGAEWLASKEVRLLGDWARRVRNPRPGGWAYEFENEHYPDSHDTSVAIRALRTSRPADAERVDGAIRRGVDWLRTIQSKNGGWAAFEPYRSPLFGRRALERLGLIEPPAPDSTAHVLLTLASEGLSGDAWVGRALRWLRRRQARDGSWTARWGCYRLWGTSQVIEAMVALGVPRSDRALTRAVAWLERLQNPDGGWGEDPLSIADPSLAGRAASTPAQTSWVLAALLALPGRPSQAVEAGVEYLLHNQDLQTGAWDDCRQVWMAFPDQLHWKDALFTDATCVMALARYRAALAAP